ncbi:hypothetical protein QQZ08_009984 [Neonectria magnoliae]|uniref:SMP domain-containing protein n=1 Tax=Neonectria magnoliae TaxID=2732573 RepID=A0ABR1HKU5_9HYPO
MPGTGDPKSNPMDKEAASRIQSSNESVLPAKTGNDPGFAQRARSAADKAAQAAQTAKDGKK